MRTMRRRAYNPDPRHHKQRRYHYETRNHDGFTETNVHGHSRAFIVIRGVGSTPQKSRINARKRAYRRPAPEIKTVKGLDFDRRFSAYVRNHPKFKIGTTKRTAEALRKVLACDHDWQETHPRATEFAYRCHNCGSKKGIKPGAPDSLRDYF